MERDIIERESAVVVVDELGNSTKIPKEDNKLIFKTGVDEEIFRWVINETDYIDSRSASAIDWPIRVETSHHLEDEIGYAVRRELTDIMSSGEGTDYFLDAMDGRINIPCIEIFEYWEINETGNAELEYMEYNGVRYTPES